MIFFMEHVFKTPVFRRFHIIFWAIAGLALFISGWSQSNVFVSLTRNVYFTVAGLGLTFLLATAWQKISSEKIRGSLIGFLASYFVLGMVLTIPINPVTYGQLGIPFDELTWRHIFAGSMNFGLVLLFWAALYVFFFKKGFNNPGPAFTNSGPPRQNVSVEVEEKSRSLLVPAHKISHLMAAADYVEVHLIEKKTYLKRATIQSLLKRLEPEGFLQIHRSLVINRNALSGVEGCSKGSYTLIMNSGARLQTSRRFKPAVEALLEDTGFSPS